MADTDTLTNTPQESGESTPPQYTEIELKAIDQGWIPREEFDGDPSTFIEAPEFVRRGELFAKIDAQNRRIRKQEEALQAFAQHMSKVQEAEYQRALKTLKNERRQAFVEGEHERAFQIEEQIETIEQQRQQAQAPVVQPAQNDEYTEMFQEWLANGNDWYETDRTLRKYADTIGKELYEEGKSPSEVLKLVEREVKREFAHKFEPKTQRGMVVEPSSRSRGNSRDDFQMTAEEKAIMRKIVQVTPGYTEADYIRDLKKTR